MTLTDLACPVTHATCDGMSVDPFRLAEAPTARRRAGLLWDARVRIRHQEERFDSLAPDEVLGLVKELVAGGPVWVDLALARPADSRATVVTKLRRLIALVEEALDDRSLIELTINAFERPDDSIRIAGSKSIDERKESK